MASHRRRNRHFGRTAKPRRALLRGLMTSLVEHGRIKTTVEKAKEVRRHIERLITLGKKGDVASHRLIVARLANKEAASAIVKNISQRFTTRPGGYTRIIKIGRRPGDQAEMAFLEFVDYDFKAKATSEGEEKSAKSADKKTATKAKKAGVAAAAKKRKSAKAQKRARSAARA